MRRFVPVLALAALILAVSGCSSAPAAGSPPIAQDLPDFVLNPPIAEDAIYGVGAARMQTTQASLEFATNRARVSLAQAINTRVQNMITDHMSGTEGSDQAMTNFQESISRSLAQANLSGAQVIQRQQSKDGTWWVLVSIPTSAAKQQAIAAVGENPNRVYAQRALDEMDTAFSNYNRPPSPVSE
ncbi:MAG: LPP20 family lipoprotein [Spirochaetaceae bacterium]|jgi:leucyl aminopeptidase (aminopeptidase T)|nr:LPP20 family lipoprotein [Spirochaetaceae bacterium]